MTGNSNLWKLDLNLNTLIQYNAPGIPGYRGLYFNSTNRLLYMAPWALKEILEFNLNLTLNHSFSISTYSPYSITGYNNNNQLYTGTMDGIVLIIQNEAIVNRLNGCGGNSVYLTFILFDEYGYFSTSCGNPTNKLYLFFANGTETGKSMVTPIYPYYIGFDSKAHLIQISGKKASIYN